VYGIGKGADKCIVLGELLLVHGSWFYCGKQGNGILKGAENILKGAVFVVQEAL